MCMKPINRLIRFEISVNIKNEVTIESSISKTKTKLFDAVLKMKNDDDDITSVFVKTIAAFEIND